jgi:hypothetical protein
MNGSRSTCQDHISSSANNYHVARLVQAFENRRGSLNESPVTHLLDG